MHPGIAEYGATPARRRTLIVVAILFVAFSAMLAGTFYLKSTTPNWPTPFQFGSLLMALALMLSALCASATGVVGAHCAGAGKPEEAVRWLAISLASWLLFLFLEIVEWVRMVFLVQLGPGTSFGGTYLALTGGHWLAVAACVCWITWVLSDVRRRDILAVMALSHFLAAWWIVLTVTLYLPNSNPIEGF